MKCLIIEDQAPARRLLQKYIADSEKLELIECFSSGNDALEFLRTTTVDLIFLDIHLPTMSGLDFLRALDNPPATILTTAFSEYALDGYELDIVDYLLKPFSFDRFQIAVDKVEARISYENSDKSIEDDSFFIKSGHEYLSVNRSEILYIHSDLDYTELHLPDRKYITQETLSYWEKTLRIYLFVRVHKSYLVNVSTITRIAGNTIFFTDNQSIPIGRAYKDRFISSYVKFTSE